VRSIIRAHHIRLYRVSSIASALSCRHTCLVRNTINLALAFPLLGPQDLSLGPVDKMALSPSGKLLGCFTMDGVLHVIVCGDSFDIVSQSDTKVTPRRN